jgi:hypothetical protein
VAKGINDTVYAYKELKELAGYNEHVVTNQELTAIGNASTAPTGGGIVGLLGAEGAIDLTKQLQHSRGYTSSGIPAFAEGGHVSGPTLALIGEGGEGESVIPDSKMSPGVNAPIHQEIHVHAAAGVDTQQLAQMIHALGLGELQGALDTLAQQMGVA